MVVEDFSSPDPDFLSVREGQRVEILDDSNPQTCLVLTLPQAEGEQQEEGFMPRRCLQIVRTSVTSEEVDGGQVGCGTHKEPQEEAHTAAATAQKEKFEAETGQEVPRGTGSQEEEMAASSQAVPTDNSPLASQEKPENRVCSEETTGQDLSSPLHPLPPPDFDALTPSQASFTGDTSSANQSLQTPPTDDEGDSSCSTEDVPASGDNQPLSFSVQPHDDLLASSEQIGSYQDSRSSSCSPLPSLPPPPPIPVKSLQGFGLSSSMHSLPATFSPSSTPTMAPHKFLGYNPMMVGGHHIELAVVDIGGQGSLASNFSFPPWM